MAELIIGQIDLEKLGDFENKIAALQKRRLHYLETQMPKGSVIKFDHNGHTQYGRVLGHSGSYWSHPQFWIENVKTRKKRWVSLFQITTAYGKAEEEKWLDN